MKHRSIIMIQRLNKSPCNGNRRVPCSQEISCATISPKDHSNSFFGLKVFCFCNSCHTRQPLLETLVLAQCWLYASISNRNAVENCRLVSCRFMTMHPKIGDAHRGLLYGNVASWSLTIRPTVHTWLPVAMFSSVTLKISVWTTISR